MALCTSSIAAWMQDPTVEAGWARTSAAVTTTAVTVTSAEENLIFSFSICIVTNFESSSATVEGDRAVFSEDNADRDLGSPSFVASMDSHVSHSTSCCRRRTTWRPCHRLLRLNDTAPGGECAGTLGHARHVADQRLVPLPVGEAAEEIGTCTCSPRASVRSWADSPFGTSLKVVSKGAPPLR